MKTWRICARGAYEAVAGEPPASLRSPLRACLARPPRRINRYIRLALIGALRCTARLDAPLPADTPLFVASEHGGVAQVVALMDEIVVHGRSPMPMPFINVSSNMLGYYLAASLDLNGRNMSVARDHGAFGALLELAELEMELEPTAPAMLLGSVTECVWPLAAHRARCGLNADTALVESSYWLVVDDQAGDDGAPRLSYARAGSLADARDWLTQGERWVVDPRLAADEYDALTAAMSPQAQWRAPLCHAGHPDALVHALFAALAVTPVPRLHAVAGDAAGGYQLMAVSRSHLA